MNTTLRKEVLRLLREDEEFRYTVAGLLGLDAILSELKKLREDFNKFIELEAKRREENNRRWEENNRRWEEAYKRFETIELELKKLREDFDRAFDAFSRRLDALGARWGVISEQAFREGMRGVVEKILGAARVERWIWNDVNGEVYGHPSIVEVDIVVKDGVHILIEVKSSISRGDVAEFWRIGKLYEKINKVKPRLVMISPYVDNRALELAKALGVEIYTRVD